MQSYRFIGNDLHMYILRGNWGKRTIGLKRASHYYCNIMYYCHIFCMIINQSNISTNMYNTHSGIIIHKNGKSILPQLPLQNQLCIYELYDIVILLNRFK